MVKEADAAVCAATVMDLSENTAWTCVVNAFGNTQKQLVLKK